MSGQNRLKIGSKNNVDESIGGRRRQADWQVRATTRSVSKLTPQSNNKSLQPPEQDTEGKGIGSGKNEGSRSKRKLGGILNEPEHNSPQGVRHKDFNGNEDDLNMEATGCNNHSPTQEDQNLDSPVEPSNDTGVNKRKVAKFANRV